MFARKPPENIERIIAAHEVATDLLKCGILHIPTIYRTGDLDSILTAVPDVLKFEDKDPFEKFKISPNAAIHRLALALKKDELFSPRAEGLDINVLTRTDSGNFIEEHITDNQRYSFEQCLGILEELGFPIIHHIGTRERFILCSDTVPAWNMTSGDPVDYQRKHPFEIDRRELKGIMPPSNTQHEEVHMISVEELKEKFLAKTPLDYFGSISSKLFGVTIYEFDALRTLLKSDQDFKENWIQYLQKYPDITTKDARIDATKIFAQFDAQLLAYRSDSLHPNEPMVAIYQVIRFKDGKQCENFFSLQPYQGMEYDNHGSFLYVVAAIHSIRKILESPKI